MQVVTMKMPKKTDNNNNRMRTDTDCHRDMAIIFDTALINYKKVRSLFLIFRMFAFVSEHCLCLSAQKIAKNWLHTGPLDAF